MNNDKIGWTQPYYMWHNVPLSKVDFIINQREIIQDNLIEFDLERIRFQEAQKVIAKIKSMI
jgi:hypothetical protein